MKYKFVANRRKTKDGYAVEVYASAPGGHIYVPTGLSVKKENWCGEFKGIDAAKNNLKLKDIKRKIDEYEMQQMGNRRAIFLDDIRAIIKEQPTRGNESFYQFACRKLREDERLKDKVAVEYSLKYLDEFKKEVRFQQIEVTFAKDFDNFLRRRGLALGTIVNVHSHLKQYIRMAVNEGLILPERNPYNSFAPQIGKKEKEILSFEEIKKLTEHTFKRKAFDRDRKLFLLEVWTGLSYADWKSISRDRVQEIDGQKILRMSRHKTNVQFIVPRLPEAVKRLESYDYQIKVPCLQNIDVNLKEIASNCSLGEELELSKN